MPKSGQNEPGILCFQKLAVGERNGQMGLNTGLDA